TQTYSWDFGDGTVSAAFNPSHTYTNPGTYIIMLAVWDNTTCNSVDTVYKTITIESPVIDSLSDLAACSGQTVTLGLSNANPAYQYLWSPADFLNNSSVANPVFQ